ncbi:MAG: outer membrane beta-barrel protein [Treponema sp.]|jgi:hypothetical protein|nr:outer membrane beta-barrel protein [Treponema sp.]
MTRPGLFARAGLLALFAALGTLGPGPIFSQTPDWGLDSGGRALTAVFPLAGEEPEMIRRFHRGIMDSVAALGKYAPREAAVPSGTRIPTDMPPLPSLAGGARYALTGGVYPGDSFGDYYLQLWLWDMAADTMIYTDDLVYSDINDAMESLPGLVEWLFSHIHERVIEEEPGVWPDPLFILGLRAGLAQRWYVKPDERSPGASALNLEGGVSGALRLNSLFSLQLELLLTGDAMVYRGLDLDGSQYVMANRKYTSLSLEIPVLVKMNFRVDRVRISPLAGLYTALPLGASRYRKSNEGEESSYSWSFSVPLGLTAGIEGAMPSGPGVVFAGLRYGLDFGTITINDNRDTSFRRHTLSLYLGYEFGFFEGRN